MKNKTVLTAAVGLNCATLLWYMWEYGIIGGIILWTIVSFLWTAFLVLFVGPIWLLKKAWSNDEVELPSWAKKIKEKVLPTMEETK